jgi:predicted Holliday junction resolvase-like endonuclease
MGILEGYMGIFISLLILGLAAYLLYLSKADISKLEEQVNLLLKDRDFLNNHIGALEQILAENNKLVSEKVQENQLLTDYLEIEKKRNNDILSQKKSSEIRLGFIGEELSPFMIPGLNSKNFRHLGMPIDYVVFEQDRIVFLEVKTGKSSLSHSQKLIKQLVLDKKVEWLEFRINGKKEEKA